MNDFHNTNLPEYIEIFAVANTNFSTICSTAKSGREVRNSLSYEPKKCYLLKDCRLSKSQFEVFNSFFYARCGRRFSFRLKDYCDFKVEKQLIGSGDGKKTEFQLTKIYKDEVSPYVRDIYKPIEKTINIYTENSILVDKSVDIESGKIVLREALPIGSNLYASFEFDVVVRFEEDSFQYSFNNDGTISLDNVKLVEVLL